LICNVQYVACNTVRIQIECLEQEMDLGYRAVLFVKSVLLLVTASLFCYCPDEVKRLLGFVCFIALVDLPNTLSIYERLYAIYIL